MGPLPPLLLLLLCLEREIEEREICFVKGEVFSFFL